jgi:hypothetical protein
MTCSDCGSSTEAPRRRYCPACIERRKQDYYQQRRDRMSGQAWARKAYTPRFITPDRADEIDGMPEPDAKWWLGNSVCDRCPVMADCRVRALSGAPLLSRPGGKSCEPAPTAIPVDLEMTVFVMA